MLSCDPTLKCPLIQNVTPGAEWEVRERVRGSQAGAQLSLAAAPPSQPLPSLRFLTAITALIVLTTLTALTPITVC